MRNGFLIFFGLLFVLASTWALWPRESPKSSSGGASWEPMSVSPPAASESPVGGVVVPVREPVATEEEAVAAAQSAGVSLLLLDALTGTPVGGPAKVTCDNGLVVAGERDSWVIQPRPLGSISVVLASCPGYYGEEFTVLHSGREAPVELRLRRTTQWAINLVDEAGAGIAGVSLDLESVDGGGRLLAPPSDNNGLTIVAVPPGAYLARVHESRGLVPVSATPVLPGGFLDSSTPARVVLGRLRMAAVRFVGDEVLGGYLQRGFSPGIAMASYLKEAQALEESVRNRWPEAIVAAAIPGSSGDAVWVRGFAKNGGWLARECSFRDAGPAFEPQVITLEAGATPLTGVVRVQVLDASGQAWDGHPFFLQVAAGRGEGSLNVEIGAGGDLVVPLGRVTVHSLQIGVHKWVEMSAASMDINDANRFALLSLRAKELLIKRRIVLYVEDGGALRTYSGIASVFDGGLPIGQAPVDRGVLELWAPARSLEVRGVVRIGERNQEVKANIAYVSNVGESNVILN